jgi:predicted transposase YbfD/YdcC
MAEPSSLSITEHFAPIEDPRIERSKRHKLIDIIVIAICGVICGAEDWVAIERFGQAKLEWFQTFLELPNGIPVHDTFGRVFGVMNPEQFQHSFLSWVQSLAELSLGQIIAIDGKMLRHSFDRGLGKAAIHMVSAWASVNRLDLGQLKVAEKSNEIRAIAELLKLRGLKGCIVTIDAMGCQTEMVARIVAQEADYVISFKGNQSTVQRDVQAAFAYAQETEFGHIAHEVHQTTAKPPMAITVGWKFVATPPSLNPISSPILILKVSGPAYAALVWSKANDGSESKSVLKPAITSPV